MKYTLIVCLTLAVASLGSPLSAQPKTPAEFAALFPDKTLLETKPGDTFVLPRYQPNALLFPRIYTVVAAGGVHKISNLNPLAQPLIEKLIYTYVGMNPMTSRAGRAQTLLVFSTTKGMMGHVVDEPLEKIVTNFANYVPDMIRLDYVNRLRKLLVGATIYPMVHNGVASDPNDMNSEAVFMPKFIPVKVKNMRLTDSFTEPIELLFLYPDGTEVIRSYTISTKSNIKYDDKPFLNTSLMDCITFYDPRLTHEAIREPVWKAIQAGQPQKGMTPADCRLAMGKPKEKLDTIGEEQVSTWYYTRHLGRRWSVRFVNGKLKEAASFAD